MTINVKQYRKDEENRWSVPLFETALSSGIMPLFVNKDEVLYHIGTAFLICRFGVFVTAAHCILQALAEHGFDTKEFEPGHDYDLDLLKTNVKLSVLHWHNDGDRIRASVWSVASMTAFPPTDVAYGSLNIHNQPNPVVIPTLSFALPGCETEVLTLGYPKNNFPPIDLRLVHEGRFDWSAYRPPLVVTAGRVSATILRGYNFAKGPCAITTCPTENGMSGGPVINAAGNVCGIVSGSMILAEGNGSLASLLYPVLCMPIRTVWEPQKGFRMNVDTPLIDAVPRGWVKSDGTEQLHRVVKENGRWRVDPQVTIDNRRCIFDTRADYHDDRPSQPLNNSSGAK